MKYFTTEIGNFVLISETQLILLGILGFLLGALLVFMLSYIINKDRKKDEYMATLDDVEYRNYNEYLKTL